jgi:hypothetical protein
VALVSVVPAAPAAISVGEIPTAPGAVAAQTCAAGTFGVTSTAVPPRYEIPGDGVLTSWRTYTGAVVNQGPVRLKVIRAMSPTSFKVVAASAYITPVYLADGNNGPFATRIPVVANDLIALGVGPLAQKNAPYCLFSGDGAAQSRVKIGMDDPPNAALALPWDAMPTYTYRVSVSASLEPDLDHDGYGDETQDGCPMDATTHGSCATPGGGPSTPAPGPGAPPAVLAKVASQRIAPTTFPASPSGQSVRAFRGRYGTTVTYTLNEAALTRFTVTQLRRGRKAGSGRCVASTRRNRTAKSCARRVTLPGHFTLAAQPGANSFAFTGRIGGKRLKPGSYRLVATPTANGRTGQPVSASFRIVK